MSDYISREAAIEAAKHAWAKGLEPSQYLEIIPAADVEPVRHGRWGNYEPYYDGYRCSYCKNTFRTCQRFCPNCGAKMDLEELK